MGTAVARLPLRGQSSQCPAPIPTCGAHMAKGAASTWTPLGFCTMAGPPVCPQPCKVTQALSHPPRTPGVGHSLLSHLHLEIGIQAPGRADGLFQGLRGRHPRAAHPRTLRPTPALPGLLTFLPGDFSGCRDRAQGLWNA